MEQEKKKINFKIIIVIVAIVIIAVVGIVIFTSKDKGIQLTSENYSDYLQINANIEGTSTAFSEPLIGTYARYYDCIKFSVDVKGLSNNFIYKDVEVEVHFFGEPHIKNKKYYSDNLSKSEIIDRQKFDETLKVLCDVSGNIKVGEKNSQEKFIRNNYAIIESAIGKNGDIKKEIKVKGTVIPSK